jgi:hypothetical protein
MLRKFFIWRAEKKMDRTQYRFDKRHYKGVFNAGFFAHLNQTKFWQSDNDPYERARNRRRKLLWGFVICVIIALIWVAFESSRALSIF